MYDKSYDAQYAINQIFFIIYFKQKIKIIA